MQQYTLNITIFTKYTILSFQSIEKKCYSFKVINIDKYKLLILLRYIVMTNVVYKIINLA